MPRLLIYAKGAPDRKTPLYCNFARLCGDGDIFGGTTVYNMLITDDTRLVVFDREGDRKYAWLASQSRLGLNRDLPIWNVAVLKQYLVLIK